MRSVPNSGVSLVEAVIASTLCLLAFAVASSLPRQAAAMCARISVEGDRGAAFESVELSLRRDLRRCLGGPAGVVILPSGSGLAIAALDAGSRQIETVAWTVTREGLLERNGARMLGDVVRQNRFDIRRSWISSCTALATVELTFIPRPTGRTSAETPRKLWIVQRVTTGQKALD